MKSIVRTLDCVVARIQFNPTRGNGHGLIWFQIRSPTLRLNVTKTIDCGNVHFVAVGGNPQSTAIRVCEKTEAALYCRDGGKSWRLCVSAN